jgi:hypothetical protein
VDAQLAATFTWNTDKSYLAEPAAEGVPVAPTVVVTHRDALAVAGAKASG